MLRSDVPGSRPTLLSSCALATTPAEARFRISRPDTSTRDARVIAVDEQAAVLVRTAAAARDWRGGHFLVFDRVASGAGNGDEICPASAIIAIVCARAAMSISPWRGSTPRSGT